MHDADRDSTPDPWDRLDGGLAAGFGPVSTPPPRQDSSILAALALRCGGPMSLSLRADAASATVDAPADVGPGRTAGKYEFLGELARGGIGVVLRGRDRDLGRDVAIKVLHDRYKDDPALLRRFVEEAQIGGQLQHPGVVPVYDLGLHDGKPFFSMKLIAGRTLAVLLQQRRDASADRGRLLGVFEQICQTMAYAHARGVVHRDLKPANVMVGAFGEVQVVDWGMAKVLGHGADVAVAEQATEQRVATVRSRPGSSVSVAGAVMGTPAYMPPEQANGDVARIDERSDVFSLGAILCEILTGAPPYRAPREQLLAVAAAADLDDARRRLAASGADPELVTLAADCLSADPAARPRSGEAVAGRVVAHLAAVEQRAEGARIAAAEQRVKAQNARRAQRLTLALAASVLATAILGGGGWVYLDGRQRARATAIGREVDDMLAEATRLRGQAEATESGLGLWANARTKAEAAHALAAAAEGGEDLLERVAVFLAGLTENEAAARRRAEQLAKDRAMVDLLETVPIPKDDDLHVGVSLEPGNARRRDEAYRRAFAGHGIDVEGDHDELVRRIAASPIARELALALDDWADARAILDAGLEPARRLQRLARAVDPDPWRNRLRDWLLAGGGKADELRAIAGSIDLAEVQPASLLLLGRAFRRCGALDEAAAVLAGGQVRHPSDFLIAFEAGRMLQLKKPPDWARAARYFTAAAALRPHSADAQHQLGLSLSAARDIDAALAVFSHKPPGGADGHWRLHVGELLEQKDDLRGAIAAYREAIAARPEARASLMLGRALLASGDDAGGIAALREAVAQDGSMAAAHHALGLALLGRRDVDGAVAAFSALVRAAPADPSARTSLGGALAQQGRTDAAIAVLREAIALQSDYAPALYNLASNLTKKGDHDGAERAYRDALAAKPDFAKAWCNLAGILARKRMYAESLDAYERGHAFGTKQADWNYPSEDWVAKARQLADAERPALTVMRGEAAAADAQQAFAAADCAECRKLLARAVELYVEGVAAAAAVPPAQSASVRLQAARSVCRAATDADAAVSAEQRAAWRGLARRWLREALASWSGQAGSVADRGPIAEELARWQRDPALAVLRNPSELAAFEETERTDCVALWREVQEVLDRRR